ncbi:MAG: alpha/beta fold hydrolase [Deferrisomatales bacterium]|nr:alpha/beta fold hydrolase [Deferrisomatales bacterium]
MAPAPDRPTLVFIHGSGASSVLWSAQVDALADVANTVAVDLPGHGGSSGPSCDSVSAYAEAVAGFLRTAEVPRPIPCGLSIGGAICLQLLLDVPGALRAGILVGTGARLRVNPTIFEAIARDYPAFVRTLPDSAASPQTPPDRLAALLEATARTPPAITAGDFRACDRFDVMARLGEIARPVLVVSAADDRLTPPKYADHLVRHIPGARRAHLRAAGHLMPLEQPEAFNAAVRAFLNELTSA